MGDPTISVIIPTFNRAHVITRAIRSVLAQTVQDFEIIIVDDASSDETPAMTGRINSTKIRFMRHEHRRGAAAARNTGLEMARGNYIAFLDDDDEWLPEKLDKQLTAFRGVSDRVGVVFCGFMTVSERSGQVIRVSSPESTTPSSVDFLESTQFMTSVPLIRRSCFDVVGNFDSHMPGSQDRDLWIRLAKHFSFASVPDVLVKYYVHGSQISTDLRAKIRAKEHILIKYIDELENHPRILAKHLMRIGLMYCADGEGVEGRRYLLEAMQADPRQTQIRYHVLMSLLDARAHSRFLLAHVFQNVEGITLFY